MFSQCNVTLMVADMHRAVRFYTDGLGLELGYRAGNEWAQVSGPGLTTGLHPAGGHFTHQTQDGRISIGFQVPKLAEATASSTASSVMAMAKAKTPVAEKDQPFEFARWSDAELASHFVFDCVRFRSRMSLAGCADALPEHASTRPRRVARRGLGLRAS
jgi:catechol 2,3-dioxygenase-like lactoylglutathione lyase family enzyme